MIAPGDLIGLVYDLPPQQVPCSWLLSRRAGCKVLRWAAKMQRIDANQRFYWHKRKRASRAWKRR